jgi:hypothetical protein
MEVSPIREFNFDGLSSGNTAVIDLMDRIDVSQWTEGQLMVNVHSRTIGASGKIEIRVFADGYTADNPSIDFMGSSALATVTVDGSTGATAYLTQAFSAGFGPLVKVRITGTGPSSGGCKAELTIRACLKSGT